MKNYDSYMKEGISWNDFEVIARNCTHAVRFENHPPINHEWDFRVQVRNNASVNVLDTEQVLDYTFREDDMERMEEFRVKRNNIRFEFSVENPSDKAYQEHATH